MRPFTLWTLHSHFPCLLCPDMSLSVILCKPADLLVYRVSLCLNRKHAVKFEREFFEDLETLGCKTPSMVMRVTEYIPEITDYIDKIHQKGMAYTSNGSVYFDTQAFE